MHAKHTLNGKITSTVPTDIIDLLLMPDEQLTPHEILQNIKAYLDTTNIIDQLYLKKLFEQCNIKPGQIIYEYIKDMKTFVPKCSPHASLTSANSSPQ